MKKRAIIIVAALSFLLTACSGKNEETMEPPVPEPVKEQELQETDNMNQMDNITEESESTPDSSQSSEIPCFLIDNPSQEYYMMNYTIDGVVSSSELIPELRMLTEESNEITDTDNWFDKNGLEHVMNKTVEDNVYLYKIEGDDGYSGYLLDMYTKESGEYIRRLDFSEYRYADDFKEEDRDFVEQRIWWAQTVDDILYVAIGHNTYTESSPHTGYMVAINLNDMSVIWKSEPCITNARTFEIIGNTIICGYGFTSEPDYLNLIDRTDGSLIEKIPIKTQADYIIYKDDILYVRTYNTDYTFQVMWMIECY